MFQLQAEALAPLLDRLSARLKDQRRTLATAESCTGGLVASILTYAPGSSRFYLGGVSAYSNESKKAILRVPDPTIDYYGAVSREVAEAMAEGAKKIFKSDYAVAITGIAGPQGEEPGKPVGTTWVGFAGPWGVRSKHYQLKNNRTGNRAEISRLALEELCGYIESVAP